MKKFIIIAFAILVATIALFLLDKNNENIHETQKDIVKEENTSKVDDELSAMFENEPEQNTFSKIEEKYENEEISIDQMYAYKLVSMFDSSQLDKEYISENNNSLRGDRLIMMIKEDWDKFTPETQAILEPVTLPFTDENSFFYHNNYELREEIISKLAQL